MLCNTKFTVSTYDPQEFRLFVMDCNFITIIKRYVTKIISFILLKS